MGKPRKRPVNSKPTKVKTACLLSPEAAKRLRTAAVHEGHDQSEIVEHLVNTYLAAYVISVAVRGSISIPLRLSIGQAAGTR